MTTGERATKPGPELTALRALYARHAPDLERLSGDHLPMLLEAARSHVELAGRRAPGETLIRVRDARVDGAVSGPVVEVVTDDMPFLVQSLLAEVARAGGEVTRVIHPIVVVRRDADGGLDAVLTDADPAAPPADATVESWIHLDLEPTEVAHEDLSARLAATLRDVREIVDDAEPMTATALRIADALPAQAPPGATAQPRDVAELLRWLADGHVTFLGYARYTATADGDLVAEPGSGLGVLRREAAAREFAPRVDTTPGRPDLLVITRASESGPLRPEHPYYLAVATFDGGGRLTGEHRFLGMLTVPALYESVLDIPVIARRVRDAIRRAGFPLESYSGQQMLEVLSDLPREELFSAGVERLHDTAVGVLAVAGRRAVRLFLRPDPYRRFLSCLVYLPRDRYTTSSRLAMAEVLRHRLGGTDVDHTARVSESALALVQFTVHAPPDAPGFGDVDVAALQDELTEAVRTWDDRLQSTPDGAEVAALLSGVPETYKAAVDPQHAVADLRRIAGLSGPGDFAVRLHDSGPGGTRRFGLYLAGAPATLTAVLPLLQQLGVEVLDERPSEFVRPDGLRCWLYDFGVRVDEATRTALAGRTESDVEAGFCAAFSAAWRGDAETDRFSALVLRAGLPWREVAVLRAYARYARQIGSPYTPQYMADTLLAQPAVARALLEVFRARFDPSVPDRETAQGAALAGARALVDAVTGLDADRILRGYLAMITATLRTNWFRGRDFFSFKIDPSAVPDMPAPRPRFEIWVYSPRVEGVHLRFGAVARGGLRWSDRPQDFRTEILGLVKAQAVKNAVIVPVGAKGGFFVRAAQPDPAEVEACYRMFISGLLDVTDNLVDGATVPPPDVVRHDGDDSYLVVAADKGTARFSDTANEVAASYGFWLGDAFASGGSVGYDHKAMGITAKGAWESVKRHFRELGVDTQSQEFTVVGVGDMSGDVFGNGMLLSPHIRLLAAFDHRHVFVDPTPDAATSFAERERMFALPRSSWDDYDRSLISAGGGVWARTEKSVPVGPEMRDALGLAEEVTRLSPPELIAAILRAPADLLWNGGIGTYVKAVDETHDAAGDKANDAVRADGAELRVKVVGEGGNLGLTQRGRIEFARAGGKINTDAIDNSAGVDCSDHEVNIKILLDRLVAAGDLDRGARDAVLAEMTDEVSELVLADNRDQNAVLGISRAHAPAMAGVHGRLTADLEERHGLVRRLEVLPDEAGFAALEAAGEGLSSPELATLLAHTKLALTAQVVATDLPDVGAFAARLPEYFPREIRERFPAAIAGHPLRREIVTTQLVNEMVDGAGMTYAFRLSEETASSATDAVRAYAVTTAVFDLPALWAEVGDPRIPTAVSDEIVLDSRRLLDRASRWFLTNRPQPLAVGAEVARFAAAVRGLRAELPGLLRGRELVVVQERSRELAAAGVGAECALRSAALMYGYGLLDVVELVELSERDREPREPREVAELYYALSEHLGIDLALTSVTALERGDRWHALARLALRDDLYGSLRAITLDALREAAPGTSVEDAIAQWEQANASRLVRARAALHEVGTAGQLDLATLSVVSRQLRGLAR
ncbi:NAD-glutamate dehydrogenase [Pseudonocardia hydrocarbonoxydans]|uniref:Glutamate dehydrogenase n=1 Tax=Pseudonocardia hydrocarbonoxydans TaxID=76726 RepID=A0A4Y3WQH1_9PSEU|nr:NAD-glutamate dehydrogenase [Pseudonocardia hydrocarbonoxydans]GEC21113.1 glutamate dehydrogenase [Pseudonocardia hydrocarbonoxydans]